MPFGTGPPTDTRSCCHGVSGPARGRATVGWMSKRRAEEERGVGGATGSEHRCMGRGHTAAPVPRWAPPSRLLRSGGGMLEGCALATLGIDTKSKQNKSPEDCPLQQPPRP